MAIRNGLSDSRVGSGMSSSSASINLPMQADLFRILRMVQGRLGVATDDRHVVAREAVLVQQVAGFQLDQVDQLRVVHQVALVEEHDQAGDATCRASRMCSRVCGIGPSAAESSRMAPSIWAAPVIMFLM